MPIAQLSNVQPVKTVGALTDKYTKSKREAGNRSLCIEHIVYHFHGTKLRILSNHAKHFPSKVLSHPPGLWAYSITFAVGFRLRCLSGRRARRIPRTTCTETEVNTKRPAPKLRILKDLSALLRAFFISKVCVRKASWLAGASINSNSNIDNVFEGRKEVVQISVGHIKRHVPYEQSPSWPNNWWPSSSQTCSGVLDLHGHRTTFEEFQVHRLDGLLRSGWVFKFDIAKTVCTH